MAELRFEIKFLDSRMDLSSAHCALVSQIWPAILVISEMAWFLFFIFGGLTSHVFISGVQHSEWDGFRPEEGKLFLRIKIFFFGHTHGMQKFPGQGLNLSHSRNLSHCSDNTGCSTQWTTRKLWEKCFLAPSHRDTFAYCLWLLSHCSSTVEELWRYAENIH